MVDSVFTNAWVPGPTPSFNPCNRSLFSISLSAQHEPNIGFSAFLRKGSSFAHLLANQDRESTSSTSIADPGAFLTPGSGNPGSEIHIPDHISQSLVNIFWDKILKFFVADPDPVLFDPGSGINIPDRIHNAVSKGS
jgi:hypothetical protein